RVNGVLNPMFVGMMVVSMSFAGALKDTFSLSTIYSGAGLLFLIGSLVMVPIMNQKAPDNALTAQES
ncbi:MFS transporter, partial [Paenibacillus sp. GCM10027629]